MARMHILQQTAPNLYDVVVHAPAPVGNNSVGVAWSAALANAGLAATQMPIGNGPGQITNAEANQVSSGTLLEAHFAWGDDPAWTDQQRAEDLNTRAGQAVAEIVARFTERLKRFGQQVT